MGASATRALQPTGAATEIYLIPAPGAGGLISRMQDSTLQRALRSASTVTEAAEVIADHLVDAGMSMPSVYLDVAGRLRCLTQRGYWQVHDGVPPEVGILGSTFRTGEPSIIPDVAMSPDFVAAGEGVVAEVAFPFRHGGRVVGVLNVELQRPLEQADVATVRDCARALEQRIVSLGGLPQETRWQLLAREAATFGALQEASVVATQAVRRACPLMGMTSAILVTGRTPELRVAASHGPLGRVLEGLEQATMASIASWSGGGASAYTFGAYPGTGFRGSQQMWDAGVAALLCVPLLGRRGQEGFLLVADGDAKRPTTEDVQVLELYAAHVTGALQSAAAFAKLRRQASRDTLTGLGHNAAFHARLDAERRQVGAGGLAVMLIDLDGFKQINDSAGHLAGDRVLADIAGALSDAVRDSDVVYRIGGDEFAAILSVEGEAEAEAVARRLQLAVRGTEHTTASVGVAFRSAVEAAQASPEELRGDADLALYEAKRRGRDRIAVFRPAMREVMIQRSKVAAELAAALQRGELFCVYQPVIDLSTARVLGVEALVRWQHPERGIVMPGEFIDIAEEDGLIADLGTHVLRAALRDAGDWGRLGVRINVGVNVSGAQLEPGLPAEIAALLEEAAISPARLVVEITESALVSDARRIEVLAELRALGAKVAVDDFGTGYSSLSYLRRLPIDIVKIDRSFVAELDDPRNAAVARAIVDLTRTLKLSSVAEGVETAEQSAQLRALGCEHAQGFWFCPPLSADEVPAYVQAVSQAGSAPRAHPEGAGGR